MTLQRLREEQHPLILLDPVRPHLPLHRRLGENGEIWVWTRDNEPAAIACLRWTSHVPIDESDLFLPIEDGKIADIAILYTIWALQTGGAAELLLHLKEMLSHRSDRPCRQIATLSPPTLMARNFHLRNHASIWRINPDSVNYQHWKQ